MEATAILQSDYLDILFDGRNKDYGGYELRLKYNQRILVALLITTAITLSTIFLPHLLKGFTKAHPETNDNAVVEIRQIVEMPKHVQTPAKQIATAPQQLASTKLTNIAITEDDKVKDVLPPVEDIQRVSDVTREGAIDDRVTVDMPAVDKGIIQPATVVDDGSTIFYKVEIDATTNFVQWRRYLENNLVKYIEQAMSDGMAPGTYTVNVRFVVERDGSITDVHALNNPGFGLAKGAEEVLKLGPLWSPGEQNGRKVRSLHTQPVTFVISEQ